MTPRFSDEKIENKLTPKYFDQKMTIQTAKDSNSVILGEYLEALFGGLLPDSDGVGVQLTHSLDSAQSRLQTWEVQIGAPCWLRWTLFLERPLAFDMAEPFPCLLSPDACWPHCISSEARQQVLAAGVALAYFNRLEIAHDSPERGRKGPVFERWPQAQCGAVSAWAWAIQRSVDALYQIGCDAQKLGVIGHSRSGKAVLLAAATSDRIPLTVAHNSGTAGAASFQVQGPGAESLQALQKTFPHWLGMQTDKPEVQQRIEEIDNLVLLKAIFPKRLCIMQASDDAWANPMGTQHAFDKLRAHYSAHGQGQNLCQFERTGGHAMTPQDWQRAAQLVLQSHWD